MEKETRNILLAGVGGLAVGAILGVLFAPDEGKKTRAKLKSKANDLLDSGAEKLNAPADLICDLKDKLESSLSDGKSDLKEELLSQIEQLEEALKK